jgi:hypothetical protein
MGHYYHFLLFVAVCSAALAADIHVSPTRSDDRSGTRDAPIPTVTSGLVCRAVWIG